MKVTEVIFDHEDKALFEIDDLQLKADAIRYSILPKLEIINNEIISRLVEVYSFSFFEHYSVAKTPHFRLAKTQRKEQTKTDYTYSTIAITGQRKEGKWLGLDKGTGIIPKISPTRITVNLTARGMNVDLSFGYPANFTKATYRKFFKFFTENVAIITGLAIKAGLKYDFQFTNVFLVEDDLKYKFKSELYDVIFDSKEIEYPVTYKKFNEIIFSNIIMFPVLNACIQIALGNKPAIEKDIATLEENIDAYLKKYNYAENDAFTPSDVLTKDELAGIKARASIVIKVMAGMRWQVFKRDDWKCVACGRKAEDNIILHVDHILPRSKGGKDEIDNYQTLCETCNIGKSNKDQTDLRRKNYD